MRNGNLELQLNDTMVDYLRLTTYDVELFDYWTLQMEVLLGALESSEPKHSPQQLMQYKGTRVDDYHIFFGSGKQNIKGMKNTEEHYLIDIAGWFANPFYQSVLKETKNWQGRFRVPRIDVQRTISVDEFHKCFKHDPQSLMVQMVNQSDWVGRKPVISYHSDLSIGLGNRKSLQYRRIYRKTEQPETIRFESEWHNRYAMQVFMTGIVPFYTKSWLNMPVGVDMAPFLGSSEPVRWLRLPSDRAKKAQWLKTSVWPSIMEEVNDYDRMANTEMGFGIQKSLDAIISIIDRLDTGWNK